MAESQQESQAIQALLGRFGIGFDVSIIGMSIVSPDGRFLRVNRAMCDLLGFREGELLASTWQSLSHPDDDVSEPEWVTAPAHGEASPGPTEKRFTHADGHTVWVLLAVTPLGGGDDSRALAYLCQVFDITKRKHREEELWEATDRFSGAFDYAAIGMALVGTDGSFLQVNRALCELTGYSRQELLAKTFQDITHPDDLEADLGYVQQMLHGEIDTYQMEKRYFRADGSLVWILLSVSLVHDSLGNPLYFVSQIQDITPRKIAEQEREALEKRLHHAQKMEAVGVLAGGAAHNFNNLLAVIQNYASFVIEDLKEGDATRADMEEIVAASKRASKIVKDLLAFSRNEGGEPDPVNLNHLVSEAEGLIRGTIGNAVSLTVRGDPLLRACFINPGQMDQIILNLVLNARQAMPGGGDLTIETSNVIVGDADAKSHPGLSQGDYVSVRVADTGIGMSEEVKSRIFEPFFTTKGRAEASGLGLASVYGIVKQWGGYVAVDSEPGRGTTMTVYLPAVPGPITSPVTARHG